MQAVGRIGSYISKSVYTVSGTFHPFGGAVDIIVVEQPDGSYKSSPWYVRFGKFQGVFKSKEKAVGITVNDVEAEFHMHLDSKGEAFFMQEVEMEEGESAASPPYSSGEDMEGQPRWPLKSKSCNYDSKLYEPIVDERKALTRANTRQSQFFGFFGRKSPPEEAIDGKENAPDGKTQGPLEVAEMAADLLDLRWSTNYGSPKCKKEKENNSSPVSDAVSTITEIDRNSVVDGSNHDEISLISQTSYQQVKSNGVEIKSITSEYIVSTSAGRVREHATLSDLEPAMKYSLDKPNLKVTSVGVVSEVAKPDSIEKHRRLSDANFSKEENERDHTHSFYSSEISGSSGIDLEVPFDEKSSSLCHGECREVCIHGKDQFTVVHEEKISVSGRPDCGASERLVTECYSQLVSRNPSTDSLKDIDSLSNAAASNSSYSTCVHMDEHNILGDKGKLDSHIQRSTSVPPCLGASKISEEELLLFGNLDDLGSNAKHLEYGESDHEGIESRDAKCCSISSLDQSDINDYTNDEYIDSRRLSSISSDVRINEINNVQPEGGIRMAKSLSSIDSLIQNLETSDLGYFSDASLCQDVNSCKEKKRRTAGEPPKPGYPPRCADSRNGYFKRSTCLKVPDTTTSGENTNSISNLNKSNVVESGKDKVKVNKKKVRTLTPTSKQLASLNLKDGKNVVIFTFSTAMLGKQQVDARIFLWRWDAKIVISDVDGTITRSDLLGQVMPLVGMDWSQTGVAHLFSAIKENGYQLLFLSARSISQSAITRQFLLNIKQDGIALPDGPIVISPDGLFPSLFREVVRRAPHEFKIACLEDIKALFPPDRNPYPFYAGFGNRDTDEVSYLKVGIPMGKIFIINPKGEIVVNHQVDTKSYMTLHSLVHGMFPNTFTCEQEDFNSWNFWKLPPPSI